MKVTLCEIKHQAGLVVEAGNNKVVILCNTETWTWILWRIGVVALAAVAATAVVGSDLSKQSKL